MSKDDKWIEMFIKSLLKRAEMELDPEELERVKADVPRVRDIMRSVGRPEVNVTTVGEEGKPLSKSLTNEQRARIDSDAHRARRAAIKVNGSHIPRSFTPNEQDLMHAQQGAFQYSICHQPEDMREFYRSAYAYARAISEENGVLFEALAGDACAISHTQTCAVWAKCAFPFVRIHDGKFAASLMATSVPGEIASSVAPPWKAFRVSIPDGILSIESATCGRVESCCRLMVLYVDGKWTLTLEGSASMVHVGGQSTENLCEDIDVNELNLSKSDGFGLTEFDGRAARLASRLVLGICMSFDASAAVSVKVARPKWKGATRKSDEPLFRNYTLGKPVRVDAREAIKQYLRLGRKGTSPSVQVLVRGHWKNQPCGSGRSDRKFIHVEPYWRGPEDAPIAVRSHILGGST